MGEQGGYRSDSASARRECRRHVAVSAIRPSDSPRSRRLRDRDGGWASGGVRGAPPPYTRECGDFGGRGRAGRAQPRRGRAAHAGVLDRGSTFGGHLCVACHRKARILRSLRIPPYDEVDTSSASCPAQVSTRVRATGSALGSGATRAAHVHEIDGCARLRSPHSLPVITGRTRCGVATSPIAQSEVAAADSGNAPTRRIPR